MLQKSSALIWVPTILFLSACTRTGYRNAPNNADGAVADITTYDLSQSTDQSILNNNDQNPLTVDSQVPPLPTITYQVGNFTTPASGTMTQTITHGLGHVPKALIVWSEGQSGTAGEAYNWNFSFGATDASLTNQYHVTSIGGIGQSPRRGLGDKIYAMTDGGSTLRIAAKVSAWDAQNFSLTYSSNDGSQINLHYLAIGGEAVDSQLLKWTTPNTIGDITISGFNWKPDAVINFFSPENSSLPPFYGTMRQGFGLGAFNVEGNQWAVTVFGSGTSTTHGTIHRAQDTNSCFLIPPAFFGNNITSRGQLVSMTNDGFTLNFPTINSRTTVFSLALKGVKIKPGSFNKGSASSQTINGVNFQPGAVMFASWQAAAAFNTSFEHFRFSLGASNVTANESSLINSAAGSMTKDGTELHVNTVTAFEQRWPSVAVANNGRFMIVWDSAVEDGSSTGVIGQLYDVNSNPVGGDFRVNTFTLGPQDGAEVAALANGNWMVVYSSNNNYDGDLYGVAGQMYDYLGQKVGSEIRINTYTTDSQYVPHLASFTDGGFVVVWQSISQDGSAEGVFGQRYLSSGALNGSEFRINTFTANSQSVPRVATFRDGRFVVAWHSVGQDGSGTGIYGQRFLSSGAKDGSEFLMNTYTTYEQSFPSIATFPDGSFVAAWQSENQDGDSFGQYGQRFDSSGAKLGTEFRVNNTTVGQQGLNMLALNGIANLNSLAAFADGRFVCSFTGATGLGDDSFGIAGQHYSSAGVALDTNFLINNYTTADQIEPSLASFGEGRYIAVWKSTLQESATSPDGRGIYAKTFANDKSCMHWRASSHSDALLISDTSLMGIYDAKGKVSSFNNDGFVIEWSSNLGSQIPTQILYLAFGQ